MATESDESDHHSAAVEDWRRGFGEASWWPFVAALGAGGIHVGAALFPMGRGETNAVPATRGPAAIAASIGAFLVGVDGRLYHAFVGHFRDRGASEHSASKLRWTIAFLGSEAATFSAGFADYSFVRANAWPPARSYPTCCSRSCWPTRCCCSSPP